MQFFRRQFFKLFWGQRWVVSTIARYNRYAAQLCRLCH
jgi:hypothetical protein